MIGVTFCISSKNMDYSINYIRTTKYLSGEKYKINLFLTPYNKNKFKMY